MGCCFAEVPRRHGVRLGLLFFLVIPPNRMKRRFTDDSWRKEPWFKSLLTTLISLRTEEDLANFLRDLGTLSELQAWSERWEVARLLAKGWSYRHVASMTGASTTTVTRVARYIENGTGGYRKMLNVHRHHRMLPKKNSPSALPAEVSDQTEQTHTAERHAETAATSALQKYLKKKPATQA